HQLLRPQLVGDPLHGNPLRTGCPSDRPRLPAAQHGDRGLRPRKRRHLAPIRVGNAPGRRGVGWWTTPEVLEGSRLAPRVGSATRGASGPPITASGVVPSDRFTTGRV